MEPNQTTFCPLCQGENVPLGELGNLIWYRCAYCGMEYNVQGEGE